MHISHAPSRGAAAGFTLIDSLIALVIAAILASIAYPSYVDVIQKTRRIDAVTAMMSLRLAQERHRANQTQYAAQLSALNLVTTSPARHYTLSITASDAQGFVALAKAIGAQAGDNRCRFLQLTVHDHVVSRASGEDAALDNAAGENKQCWRV